MCAPARLPQIPAEPAYLFSSVTETQHPQGETREREGQNRVARQSAEIRRLGFAHVTSSFSFLFFFQANVLDLLLLYVLGAFQNRYIYK